MTRLLDSKFVSKLSINDGVGYDIRRHAVKRSDPLRVIFVQGGSGGDGTLSCKDIRQLYTSTSDVNVRNMLMQKNAACLTDLDESEIDVSRKKENWQKLKGCNYYSGVISYRLRFVRNNSVSEKSFDGMSLLLHKIYFIFFAKLSC